VFNVSAVERVLATTVIAATASVGVKLAISTTETGIRAGTWSFVISGMTIRRRQKQLAEITMCGFSHGENRSVRV
jgi:hypothetical protein